ncbi:MAG: Brp/Blh family beta-carotene 15,15'-dioxygenase [Wenzhouxiangellaceae bacterium]|nr:Brp/Blh family beta-carotene 15,15'-dioxygenase [Wenzhouxiangellaceae bacterium]
MRGLQLRVVLAAIVPLLAAAPWLRAIPVADQLLLVAAPIALLGVLHGGADPWAGDAVFSSISRRWRRAAFLGAYLGITIAVLACWALAPVATLVGFLLISILHFGEQDARSFRLDPEPLSLSVLGAIPVLGPSLAHPEAVGTIFAWLVGAEPASAAALLRGLAPPLTAVWCVGAGLLVARVALERSADARALVVGIVLLSALMVAAPPLIAFAFYFCLLHSAGHLLDLARRIPGPWRSWSAGQWIARLLPASAGAVALGFFGWLALPALQPDAVPMQDALARAVFWGLAALTVPHVLLHAALERRLGDDSKRSACSTVE